MGMMGAHSLPLGIKKYVKRNVPNNYPCIEYFENKVLVLVVLLKLMGGSKKWLDIVQSRVELLNYRQSQHCCGQICVTKIINSLEYQILFLY